MNSDWWGDLSAPSDWGASGRENTSVTNTRQSFVCCVIIGEVLMPNDPATAAGNARSAATVAVKLYLSRPTAQRGGGSLQRSGWATYSIHHGPLSGRSNVPRLSRSPPPSILVIR